MKLKPWMLHMLLGAAIGALLFWLFGKFVFAILGVGAVGSVTTFAKEKIKRAKTVSDNADKVLDELDSGSKSEIKHRAEVDNVISIKSSEAKEVAKVDWDSTTTAEPPTKLDV